MKTRQDLKKLEKADFKIEKDASSPQTAHCARCAVRMRRKELEMQIGEDIFMKLSGFECPKCGKRLLGLEEAKKLDKATLLGKAAEGGFKMTRSLSFDGDNYTFRIPKEFTRDVSKRKVEIVPLGPRGFCAYVE
ncbi:hypothetical protein JW711_01920 [Candidatus Woesearchaeota archaeon]|nr:hypothetical protein [Candidatus Woesearchaeota archaeon]